MLCFENVRKVYKDFELNCSMRVEPGCITGLIGPNGAGKSTAFKAALGLIRTDGGRMEILGKPADQLLPSDREQIGVVLAAGNLLAVLLQPDSAGICGSKIFFRCWIICITDFPGRNSSRTAENCLCLWTKRSVNFPPG